MPTDDRSRYLSDMMESFNFVSLNIAYHPVLELLPVLSRIMTFMRQSLIMSYFL